MRNHLPRKVTVTFWVPEDFSNQMLETDLKEIKEEIEFRNYDGIQVQIED